MKEGWEIKKLGEVCEIERGGSPRPINKYITNSVDGINWIKIGDAVEGSKYITSTKEKIIPEGVKKSRMVFKGDFILSNSMSFGRPYILSIDGCIHDGWLVIHDTNNNFDKSFLYYYLSSKNIYNEFKRLAVGGVVNNLNSQLVRNVKVVVPPISEQARIVEELDLLNGILDKKRQQLKELDALSQSIFYDMFGDINTNNYNNVTLSDLAIKIGDGLHGTPNYSENGRCYFINCNNLDEGHIIITDKTKTVDNIEKEKYYLPLNENTILVSINGTLGKTAYYRGENVILGKSACYITLKPEVDKVFIFYILNSDYFKQYALRNATGSTIKNVSLKSMRNFRIPYPEIEQQTVFVDKIKSIERQKQLIKASIAETQTLLDSRMDYYFN